MTAIQEPQKRKHHRLTLGRFYLSVRLGRYRFGVHLIDRWRAGSFGAGFVTGVWVWKDHLTAPSRRSEVEDG